MTTDLATRETAPIAAQHHDYRSLMLLAKELVTTGFLPSAIKTPAQAVAIILTGQELGLPPMKSLRLINVIQGKPCLAAELQLALFKQRGGRAQWQESSEKSATITLTHPNGDTHTETFTLADADRAGLLKKGGNWSTYPKIMLRWRAVSNGLKAIAPDILSGVYDPDEMGAVVDMQTGEVVELPATQQAVDDVQTVEGVIVDVLVKEGKTGHKAWTRYGIVMNGQTYGTFDKEIGEGARERIGQPVVLHYKQDGQYWTVTDMEIFGGHGDDAVQGHEPGMGA
jgi:hypothetical protein